MEPELREALANIENAEAHTRDDDVLRYLAKAASHISAALRAALAGNGWQNELTALPGMRRSLLLAASKARRYETAFSDSPDTVQDTSEMRDIAERCEAVATTLVLAGNGWRGMESAPRDGTWRVGDIAFEITDKDRIPATLRRYFSTEAIAEAVCGYLKDHAADVRRVYHGTGISMGGVRFYPAPPQGEQTRAAKPENELPSLGDILAEKMGEMEAHEAFRDMTRKRVAKYRRWAEQLRALKGGQQ